MRYKKNARYLILLVTAAWIALAAACTGRGPESTGAGPVAKAEPVVRSGMLVGSAWLADHLGSSRLVVLQVSTARESYDQGHIPGAQYIGWSEVTVDTNGVANELPSLESLTALVRRLGIDSADRIIIYDDGEGVMAARAYFTLDYLGLGDSAALLDGQLAGWKAEGRPLSTEVPEVVESAYIPRINPGVIAGMDKVREITGGGEASALVDCRAADQFSGETPGSGIQRGGHIPGAINATADGTVESRDLPRFKPADQLRALYADAGLAPGGKAVTYCRTGRSASLGYFTLKYLGYDVALYDGSFSQWQSYPDNPVATGK